MEDEALTFSDLRKIQKKEKRQDQLSELDDNFLLKASQYLDRKEGVDDREYKNARRVLDKIIGLRQDKIVKNAKISVKSDVKSSKLNLLPREQEFFRDIKERFNAYSDNIDEVVEKKAGDVQIPETDTEVEQTEPEEDEVSEDELEDGYEKVKIVSNVPEFMGTDLESYGPFEEGEETELPEENADILVNRGSAEKVEN
ncbi:MAG: DNA replication initiation complex subunit (GINS family) [Candidatus Nanohaloarchaea archaeon]|jgi:DNA replication initiation complex subunit (GINS family)